GSHPAIYSAYRDPDLPGHVDAVDLALHNSSGQAPGDSPQTRLRHLRLTCPDRHLCHALECSDRRAVVLQELSWLHHLQDGPGNARGPAGSNCIDPAAAGFSVDTDKAPASMA